MATIERSPQSGSVEYKVLIIKLIVSNRNWLRFIQSIRQYDLEHASVDSNNSEEVCVTLRCRSFPVIETIVKHPSVERFEFVFDAATNDTISTLRAVPAIDNAYLDEYGNVWEYQPNGQMRIATSETALRDRFIRRYGRLPEPGDLGTLADKVDIAD